MFCVEVTAVGKIYTVERRYNDFDILNKKLRKEMETPPFPSKTVMKWSQKVLEHRREAFEHYLQAVTEGPHIPRCVLRFLEICCFEDRTSSTESLDLISVPIAKSDPAKQPVIAFFDDCFLQDVRRGSLPDMITAGVIKGFYGSHVVADDEPRQFENICDI